MKTEKEILEKIEEGFKTDGGFFNASDDLITALSFDGAKIYLKPTAEREQWEAKRLKTDKDVIKSISEYIPFAQGKIDDKRGLSADRSCHHFIGWFWLISTEKSEELESIYNNNYAPYGQPVLDKVKDFLEELKNAG